MSKAIRRAKSVGKAEVRRIKLAGKKTAGATVAGFRPGKAPPTDGAEVVPAKVRHT